MGDVDARAIDLYLRVVELGSINRAAAELRLSQPSLSRRLAQLEGEVGTALLIRTPQGVRPTDAGIVLAQRARPILRQLELLQDELGEKSPAQITIGLPFSLRRILTIPFVEESAHSHPRMRLRIYEGMNNQIRQWMEEGMLDTAVIVSTERIPHSFETRPLAHEPMFIVGNQHAKLRIKAPVPVSRLADLNIILPGRPNTVRVHVENAVRRAGFQFNGNIEAETQPLTLDLVERGLGYTVVPSSGFVGFLTEKRLVTAAPIKGLGLMWMLCVNRARAHSVVVRHTAAAVQRIVERQIRSKKWIYASLALSRRDKIRI